jgi:hypothetical protein
MGAAGAQSRPVTLDKEILSVRMDFSKRLGERLDGWSCGNPSHHWIFCALGALKWTVLITFPCPPSVLTWTGHQPLLLLPMSLLDKTYIHMNTDSPYSLWPEDGESMYLRHVGNTAHIHMVQRPETESTSTMINSDSLQSVSKLNMCVTCCGICTTHSCT